ncbi:hypothetical protein RRG08_048609 [Elysia crispata]|uniref:Uncharacterized protein n=1 Tax=Elysia crispata TaxID=231223 RepID=A0AAE1DXS9_9GAST|nr:hypothetical protein RRG08_048609 [Elysia crispata]
MPFIGSRRHGPWSNNSVLQILFQAPRFCDTKNEAGEQETESETGETSQQSAECDVTDNFTNLFNSLFGVTSSEVLTTEDIVHSVTDKDSLDEDKDDEEIPPPPPTITEARDAIKTLISLRASQ